MCWLFSRKIYAMYFMHNSFLSPSCENNPTRAEALTSILVSKDVYNSFAFIITFFLRERKEYI